MKSTDERIDRVLAGLRACEVPDGLEARVVRGLRERTSAEHAANSRSFMHPWRSTHPWRSGRGKLAAGVALCFACLAGGMVVIRQQEQQPRQVLRTSDRPMPSTDSVAAAPAKHAEHQDGAAVLLRPRTVVRDRKTGNAAAVEAASFPAPQLPLTEQERLLLRVAHRRDPASLAILDPVLQATLIAQEQQQFDTFFAPIPRIQTEGNE